MRDFLPPGLFFFIIICHYDIAVHINSKMLMRDVTPYYQYIYIKYIKHFQKMYRDVGMAMPKTTETRCRDGSVQGRHVIQRLHN